MTLKVYDKGEPVRCSVVFRNSGGTPSDPTTVTFKFTTPAGVTTAYVYPTNAQLVKDSTAAYHVDLTGSQGEWHYQWEGVGVVDLVERGMFMVRGSSF